MIQENQSYVIVGNGIAGITAAETLRQEDSRARITIITDDPFLVYYRPALKDYLAGRIPESKLWVHNEHFYERQQIQLRKGRVINILAGSHVVQLDSGQRIDYSHLLLALGAQPSTLSCPGINLAGVTTLRTLTDYQRIIKALHRVRRVVVSGSGTLALETIETLRDRGHQVTHLVRKKNLWSEVLDQTASDLVLQQERRDGVDVRLENEIAEIRGSQQVQEVYTTQGERIACDMVIIAIGIEPNVELAKQCNIACGRGIKVNTAMRTSDPAIYAAGDIVETVNIHSGCARPLGQWYPAIQQARAAAYGMLNLLDMHHPFDASTFYNATFLYGLDFACAGLTNLANTGSGQAQGTVPTERGSGQAQSSVFTEREGRYQEIVADPEPRVYRKAVLKDGIPVGMLALGDRMETLELKRAIDHHVDLTPVAQRLFERDFVLRDWLDQQRVPPPWPGVKRDGEVAMQEKAFHATGTYHTVLFASKDGEQSKNISRVQDTLPKERWLQPFNKETVNIPGVADVRLSMTRVMTIGRREGVYLCIDHYSVSRNHAEIRYIQGQYILRDLGSKNGTRVNGRVLASGSAHILKPQDQIQLGQYISFIFQERTIQVIQG